MIARSDLAVLVWLIAMLLTALVLLGHIAASADAHQDCERGVVSTSTFSVTCAPLLVVTQ